MVHYFSRRSLTWTAITVFALVLLLQTLSYVHLILIQDTTVDNVSVETDVEANVADRDFAALQLYLASLCIIYVVLTLTKWHLTSQTRHKRRTGQEEQLCNNAQVRTVYSWLRRLLSLRIFGIVPPLGQIIQASILVALNALLLLLSSHTATSIPTRAGQLALVNMSMAVALSARVYTLWRGYGIEQTLKFHRWFAWIGASQTLYHATFYFNKMYRKQKLLYKLMNDVRYPSGLVLVTSVTILILGSHPLIRATAYRLFRLTHLISFTAIVAAGMFHHWIFIIFYTVVAFVWMWDQWQLWKSSSPARVVAIEALPGNICKLQVQPSYSLAPADFYPGQFAFVSFRGNFLTSRIAPNAFSISRVDYTDNMLREEEEQKPGDATGHALLTFYIRAKGARTLALRQLGLSGGSQAKMDRFRVSRPIGYPVLDFAGREYSDFHTVVLVCEGIGFTPWLSVLQHLGKKGHRIATQHVTLIWTMQNADTLRSLSKELKDLLIAAQIDYKVKVHLTRQLLSQVDESIFPFYLELESGYPDYKLLFEEIRSKNTTTDVALGICAHNETVDICSDIARSKQFSHRDAMWVVRCEQFEL